MCDLSGILSAMLLHRTHYFSHCRTVQFPHSIPAVSIIDWLIEWIAIGDFAFLFPLLSMKCIFMIRRVSALNFEWEAAISWVLSTACTVIASSSVRERDTAKQWWFLSYCDLQKCTVYDFASSTLSAHSIRYSLCDSSVRGRWGLIQSWRQVVPFTQFQLNFIFSRTTEYSWIVSGRSMNVLSDLGQLPMPELSLFPSIVTNQVAIKYCCRFTWMCRNCSTRCLYWWTTCWLQRVDC